MSKIYWSEFIVVIRIYWNDFNDVTKLLEQHPRCHQLRRSHRDLMERLHRCHQEILEQPHH